MRENAYAPYSHFLVGAALIDDLGQIHVGANVENASYGATICAERSAVCSMISNGGKRIEKLAVVTSNGVFPCGVCLQVLSEFCDSDAEFYICDENGLETTTNIGELLPHAFLKNQLLNPIEE